MFKKTLFALAILSIPYPAIAQDHFTGSVSTFMKGPRNGSANMSKVTYNCNDAALGHFDMCVDVLTITELSTTNLKMSVKINPLLAKERPIILIRYHLVAPRSFHLSNNQVTVTSTMTGEVSRLAGGYMNFATNPTAVSGTFYQTTEDGGNSWSKITFRAGN